MDWDVLRTSDLPVRYSEFGGNANENGADAEYVTDRHMMWRASAANEDRNERLTSKADKMNVDADRCGEVFSKLTNETARGELKRLSLTEIRTSSYGRDTYDEAKLESESGETVFANAQYLRILSLVTGFNKLRTDNPQRAIIAYRDGDVVGVVMPLREPRGPEKWEDREILVENDNE